ncbi:uncharacterized protein LOC135836840 isoform X3 [Planococcus citri]|uniref:uncharacterized protein LOC135836840 isoform X3 n=1 Tax=Planococcus citri TaxID=170843 RepID=UPI0031F99600
MANTTADSAIPDENAFLQQQEKENLTQENEKFGLYVLENLLNDNLVTDIGEINYSEGEDLLSSRQFPLAAISEPFCDNIILAKIYDRSFSEKQDSEEVVTKSFINFIANKFNEFLPTSELKHRIRTDGSACSLWNKNYGRAKGIKEIIRRHHLTDILREKYKDAVYMTFRIDLADETLKTLLAQLPKILKELQEDHYFLLDMDVTEDLTGIFNKQEMRDYLTKNFIEFQENYNEIVKDNQSVGIDCLTWVYSNVRVKIYNKFICQMTSPGVRQQIGNHIVDFIDCPKKRLRDTFSSPLAKQHGVLRLEVTIYNFSYLDKEKLYDPVDDCLQLLEANERYLEKAPIYSVPISTMWRKLTSKLQNSCCLVNGDVLQYVYWANGITGKFTGIQIVLPTDQIRRKELIDYALSQFSFNNLEVNYVEIVQDDNGQNIKTEKCYIKRGQTYSYFSHSNTFYSNIPFDLDIHSTGLCRTKHVNPQVLRNNGKGRILIEPTYLIKEIDPKFHKWTPEDMPEEQKVDENLVRVFREGHCEDLDLTGEYIIYGFAVISTEKFRNYIVVVQAEKRNYPGMKSLYYIKGARKYDFVNRCRDETLLIEEGYKVTTDINNGTSITSVQLPEEEIGKKPFAEFKTNGIDSFCGISFPKIEELYFYTDEILYWDDAESMFGETIRTLITLFKFYNWKTLDSVGKYFVFAFAVTKKSDYPYVGVLAQKKGTEVKRVYKFQGFDKFKFIDRYNDKDSLIEKGYKIIYFRDFNIVYLPTEEPLAEFETNGLTILPNGNTFPVTEKLVFYKEMIFEMTEEELKNAFQRGDCLDTYSKYDVFAFTVDTHLNYPDVRVLAQKMGETSIKVCSVKGKLRDKFVQRYKRKILLEQMGYKKITSGDLDILFLVIEKPFATFVTKGINVFNDRKYTRTDNLQYWRYDGHGNPIEERENNFDNQENDENQ